MSVIANPRDGRSNHLARMTRRAWLARAGLLAAGSLLAACSPPAPAPAKPAEAPKPTEAPPAAKAASGQAPAGAAPTQAAKPAEAVKPAAVDAKPTAPAATTGRRGGKVTWAIEQDPVHLIPFGGSNTSNHWGKEFMYDSLLEWDRDLKVQPALAESWEAPDDKTYVFKLRRGVKFHDGKELDGEDVKYSLELQANPPPPGAASASAPEIASVDVVDKYTVKLNMKKPDPTLIGYLAWARYSPIVPKGIYDRLNVLTQGIGTGPFKLVEYISNDRVVYERYGDFWKPGLPYLDELTLKVMPDEQARVAAIRSGAIDGAWVSSDVSQTLKNDRSLVVQRGLFAAHRELQFVMKDEQKPWHDKRVRQAINHAINRDDVIEKVYGGDAEYSGIVPPGYGDWPLADAELKSKFLKHDLERARQLMAEAGLANGFQVTLQTRGTPREYLQMAEIFKEHLAPIKIDVTVQPIEGGLFSKNNADGTFDWQVTGRGMRGDVSGYVAEFHPSTRNFKNWFEGGWKNDELIKLLDDGLATVDQDRRKQIYRRVQEILLDELPHVPIAQPYRTQIVRARVQNMYVAYTDFNTGLREAWVEG